MRTFSDNRPKKIERLGNSLYSYNFDIQQNVEGEYSFIRLIFNHPPNKDEVINTIIDKMFPNGEELAIQRKGIVDNRNDEFITYNNKVEEVKHKVNKEYEEVE